MIPKIAVINDLSGFGKCSLTAAISSIAAMGVQPCPLPTAVLSAQTGFESYYYDDYTEKMEHFRREWEKMQVCFDGIYTGFVSSEQQIDEIFSFLKTFYKDDTFLLVDPIMGDEGRKFVMFTEGLLEKMKQLAARADIITPNLTELCFLTDHDYEEVVKLQEMDVLVETIDEMAKRFLGNAEKDGPETIVVTGIRFMDPQSGERKIGNLLVTETQCRLSAFPYVGGSYSGTGDLYASILAGGTARGDAPFESMELAGRLIERAMKDAAAEQIPRNEGANYETYLWMLTERNRSEQRR